MALATSACTLRDIVAIADPVGPCEPGSTATSWATSCPTSSPTSCVPGVWTAAGSANADDTLVSESQHFAVYSNGVVTQSQAQAMTSTLETVVWPVFFRSPMFLPEPYCNSATKKKTSIMVRSGYGIAGGAFGTDALGIWISPQSTTDHWGLAHTYVLGLITQYRGLTCPLGTTSDTCGWFQYSYANFMAHQLAEFRSEMHCSELLVNSPHLYLGSTRDRYCNWQFLEYLKDKHCFAAVNDIWNTSTTGDDPFKNLAATQGWSTSQLNDFFGEWAMHNITWDYVDPAPVVSSIDSSTAFRAAYGDIADVSVAQRRLRLTTLEPLEASFETGRRFYSPYLWAPQRWGYNVVRLYPDHRATSVTVTFRGVTQSDANSDWRWGVVRTDTDNTTARYSPLQRGANGAITVCSSPGENLWLVVMGTPSERQSIYWEQPYPSIYRYPYMIELTNAWPLGSQGGQRDPCPIGLTRHVNGGGCAPPSLAPSVYVGPYAQVLGGAVSGTARIDGHATIVSGAVTGGTVTGLSIISGINGAGTDGVTVSGDAKIETSFYPIGYFEAPQLVSGTTRLYGDVELRGANLSLTSGAYTGKIEADTKSQSISEVTSAPPYAWRP